jgi:hypothetical protein
VISEALFKDISEKLSKAKGKGPGESEYEGETEGEESEYEGETEAEVTENGEISPPLTPQTHFSNSSSSRHDSNCSPEYTDQCDPTEPQPDINDKATQGAAMIPNPDLGRVDELLAAAALRGMPYLPI